MDGVIHAGICGLSTTKYVVVADCDVEDSRLTLTSDFVRQLRLIFDPYLAPFFFPFSEDRTCRVCRNPAKILFQILCSWLAVNDWRDSGVCVHSDVSRSTVPNVLNNKGNFRLIRRNFDLRAQHSLLAIFEGSQLMLERGGLLSRLFNLLSNQAEHLIGLITGTLHLGKLSAHYPELHKCRDGIGCENASRQHLKKIFPDWRLIGTAVLGLFGVFWGWWNVRLYDRANRGMVFIASFCLWVIGLYGIVLWGFGLC